MYLKKVFGLVFLGASGFLVGMQEELILTKRSFEGSCQEVEKRVFGVNGKVHGRYDDIRNPQELTEICSMTIPEGSCDREVVQNGAIIMITGSPFIVTYVGMQINGEIKGYYSLQRREQ